MSVVARAGFPPPRESPPGPHLKLSETLQKPGRKIKKKRGGKKRETTQRFVLLLVKIILELAGTTQEASQGE